MSKKIKHTKNELKTQTEALRRYERFLPMLQLKKQQLQMELRHIKAAARKKAGEHEALNQGLARWVGLFVEAPKEPAFVWIKDVRVGASNIAGVEIPVFEDVTVETPDWDLFATPSWYDDAQETGAGLLRVQVELVVLEEQRARIAEELRVTSQRVNLFEKVKIPETRENMRVIKIFLGDEQTAAVVRAKIAKVHTLRYEYEDAAR